MFKQVSLALMISMSLSISALASPDTDLIKAIEKGDSQGVQRALNQKASLKAADESGQNPLTLALYQGKPEIVEILLKAGGSLKELYAFGEMNFGSWIYDDNLSMMELLLRHGFAPNIKIEENGKFGDLIQVVNPLIQAATQGKLATVKLLLKYKADLNAQSSLGNTALMHAVESRHFDVATFLLSQKADASLTNQAGQSVLDLLFTSPAYQEDVSEAAKGAMAKQILASLTPAGKEKALLNLAAMGKMELFQGLISQGVNPLYTDFQGVSTLMKAAWGGNAQLVRLLLAKGAVAAAKDKTGATALSYAARGGNLEAFHILAQLIPLDQPGIEGKTPLMEACQALHPQIVEKLLAAKANPNAHDSKGFTPMMLVLDLPPQAGQAAVLKLLAQAGAQTRMVDAQGRTLLHLATAKFRGNSGTYCKMDTEAARFMAEQKIGDINAQDAEGRTALMNAANSSDFYLLKALLDHGANPRLKDKKGNTAMSELKKLECRVPEEGYGTYPYRTLWEYTNDKKEANFDAQMKLLQIN